MGDILSLMVGSEEDDEGERSESSCALLGLIIETLGRNRKTDRLNKVYTAIQDVLRTFGQDKKFSREAWFKIEGSMIIGSRTRARSRLRTLTAGEYWPITACPRQILTES